MPSTVKMASPEYHGLLANDYIPKATAPSGMDFVMQEDGAPSHSSTMTRNWRSDAANWPPTATLFTLGFPANSPDLNPSTTTSGRLGKTRLQRVDPGGSERGEEEHRELARATSNTQA